MFKKVICVVSLFFVLFSFCSCDLDVPVDQQNSFDLQDYTKSSVLSSDTGIISGFEFIDKLGYDDASDNNNFDIYRCPVTDVLYIVYHGYRKGSLTVLLNPQTGLPLTYTDYLILLNSN